MAWIDGDDVGVFDLHVMAKGKGSSRVKNQINPAALTIMLEGMDAHVFIERVSSMPGQGVASVFSLGDTFGCIRGVVAALGMPMTLVTPQEWKKHFNLGKDKEVARAKAIELFPTMPLSRKKDHNRAEALLIAQYGLDYQR